MNRQRTLLTRNARPAAISLASAKPVLRCSTRLNQNKPSPSACMSYKELIKVVGVDCETGPSSWRKAIDHSAETVVFYQVDLRGILPRMYKSVRIRLEEGTGENKELRLVPSVYVGDTVLSASYVRTIIGRRFLADEDDLMKLLEHAGVLQEEEEAMEEAEDERGNDDWDVDLDENDPVPTEPEPKRAKTAGYSQTMSRLAPGANKARSGVQSTEKDASSSQATTSGRQAIDLSAMLLQDQSDRLPAIPQAEEDTPMDTDYDESGLPPADDNDDLPLGYNSDGDFLTETIEKLPHPVTEEDESERDPSVENTGTKARTNNPKRAPDVDAKKVVPSIPFPFLARYLPDGNPNGSLVPLTTRQLVFLPVEDVEELREAEDYTDQTDLYNAIMWEYLFTEKNRRLCSEHLPTTGGRVGFKAVCKYIWEDVWDFVREVGKRKVEADAKGNSSWRTLSGEEHEKLWRSEQQSFRPRLSSANVSKIRKRRRFRKRC